jgi:hypothetical protein
MTTRVLGTAAAVLAIRPPDDGTVDRDCPNAPFGLYL